MKKSLLALAVLGAFAGVCASAQAVDLGVSAEVGTSGLGVSLVTPLRENLNLRVGVNAFSHTFKENTSDASYDLKLKLQTINALLDYYPVSSSGFRLSGGVVYNGNKVDAHAKTNASGNYTFNGNTYSVSQTGDVNGNVDFRNFVPYAGIGWGNAVGNSKGWGFTADLGVIFQGAPKSSLYSTNCTAGAAICGQLATDLAAESAELNDSTKDFRYYPVARVGVTYRFN